MRTTPSRPTAARGPAGGIRRPTGAPPASSVLVRAARRAEVARERERAAAIATADAAARAAEGLTARERAKVTSGQSVPNAPLRAAALRWVEQEHSRRRDALADASVAPNRRLATLNELFAIAGLDNTHGRRVLGLCPRVEPPVRGSQGPERAARAHYARVLRRDYALALIAAMNLDPVDLGL